MDIHRVFGKGSKQMLLCVCMCALLCALLGTHFSEYGGYIQLLVGIANMYIYT